jgi:hypothetical protein
MTNSAPNDWQNTPPTGPSGQDSGYVEESAWPNWIGGISIGFGALMLLGSCLGVAGIFLTPWGLKMAGIEAPQTPGPMVIVTSIDAILTLVLGAMLLTGGIALLRRRESGIRRLKTYAQVRVALALPLLLAGFWIMGPSAKWAADLAAASNDFKESKKLPVTEAEREAAKNTEPSTLQIGSAVAGSVLGLVYPVILLVFLGKPRVREEAARWDN